jgi:hypothetical protein
MANTTYEARAVHTNVLASTAQAEGIAEGSIAGASSTAAPTPRRMTRVYEGFLGLPVWVVLAAMWVAGATLLGSGALVVYMVGSVLLRAVVGSS